MSEPRSASSLLPSHLRRLACVLFCFALLLGCAGAQQSGTVPNLIKFSGTIAGVSGGSAAPASNASVVFALYTDQTGGAPLWQEVQSVAVDAAGHYTLLLGSSTASGIPLELFSSNEARWLGVQLQGQPEQPRVLLVSVPYALKAVDSETLGGLPASAFLRADACSAATTAAPAYVNTAAVTGAVKQAAVAAVAINGTGSAGYLPVFTDSNGDVTNSGIFQSGANVGVGPSFTPALAPGFNLHVVSTSDPAAVTVDGYGAVGINFIGRRAEGTVSSPAHLNAGDNIMTMQGRGYGSTGFSGSSRAYLKFFAAENWSDAAQGTFISLATTPVGTVTNTERMRIDNAGNVGIGTTSPTSPLTVHGVIQSTSGGVKFPDGTTQTTAQPSNLTTLSGNLSATGVAYLGSDAFQYDTSLCMIGDVVLSVNGYGSGALPADGRLLAISQYTAAFSIMGTNFGGDGKTTFGLPDLRSFAPQGLQYSICVGGIFPARL